jgi:hypothetical protein
MQRSTLTLMDLPNETLEDIFHEALSPEKSLTSRQFKDINVEGWSRLNRRLSPIALSALLRRFRVVVGLDGDLLLERLLAPNSTFPFALVKELNLQIQWYSEDVLLHQKTLRSIARIPSRSSQRVHLGIFCYNNFSTDDSAQLSSIVADWNVAKLDVVNYGADVVLPQLPSVSYVSLYYLPLYSVPTSFYTNIKSLELTECSMDSTAEMRIRNASVEKLMWQPCLETHAMLSVECLPPGLLELEFDASTIPAQQNMAIFRKLLQLQHLRAAILRNIRLTPSQWPEAIAALPRSLTRLTLRPYVHPEPQIALDAILSGLRNVSHLPHLCQLNISPVNEPPVSLQTTLADTLRDELGKRGVQVSFG